MTWWTGRALGLDFETDGVDPTQARAITCALVSVGPGVAVEPMELMLAPERDIPDGAAAIHGITTEYAQEHGVMREAGIAQIVATIAAIAGPDVPVVGHNVGGYDLTLLDREMRRTGIGRLEIDKAAGHQVVMVVGGATAAVFPVIDTLVLDKAVDQYRPGKRQLAVTAEFYGFPMTEGTAHGATADVFASLRIAWAIAKRSSMANGETAEGSYDQQLVRDVMAMYGDRRKPNEIALALAAVGRMTLPDLHRAQVAWSLDQAEGLRRHFIKSGTGDPDGVNGEWPFRQLTVENDTEDVTTELV
jgi:DNA polymerase III subunit epsilon